MRIDWQTLALQAVNSLVLIWALGYFLFKPIAGAIAERKAAAARLLDEAQAARAEAEAAREQENAAVAGLAAARAQSLAAATQEAKTHGDALLAAARAEADALREAAKAQALHDAARARQEEMRNAEALALDIARRAADRLPADARITGFIAGLAEAAAALPAAAKKEFLTAGGATLRAQRALTPQEEDACRSALGEAFGAPLPFSVTIDPDLIAGLELENRHTRLHNSLRADLSAIAAALADHASN